jgi:hypothetical protein
MRTIRTSTNLRKCDARRLMKGGYEIDYIETLHTDGGEHSTIVWSRPARPDDFPEDEIPY